MDIAIALRAPALCSGVSATSNCLREIVACFFTFSHGVEYAPRRDVGRNRIGGGLEGLTVESQRLFRFTFTHQLLPLFDELRLLLLGGSLCQHWGDGKQDDHDS